MKAATLSVALLFVSSSALAADHHHAHKKAPPRGPTAMHTPPLHATPPAHHHEAPAVRVAIAHAPIAPRALAKPKPPCLHEPVTVARGIEEEHFALTRCDGTPLPDAIDRVSILARPESAHKPTASIADLVKAQGPDVSPGVRRVDPKLVERMQQVADHFGHGHPLTMRVISGYRPASAGSYHATAQAVDFRIDGVKNEDLVAFCKTMQDTGCGYYPNSTFIHMDVRHMGTGHVSWIDASGPGESPHYVAAWPPPPEPRKTMEFLERIAKMIPAPAVDEHPADASSLPMIPPPPDSVADATDPKPDDVSAKGGTSQTPDDVLKTKN